MNTRLEGEKSSDGRDGKVDYARLEEEKSSIGRDGRVRNAQLKEEKTGTVGENKD